MRVKAVLRGLLPAALLLSAGCGRSLTPVEGVVTCDGKPVPGATVCLMPEGDAGQPACAQTDAAGAFQVRTFRDADGAWPGPYRITVVAPPPPPDLGDTKGASMTELMRRWGEAMKERQKNPVKPPVEVPTTYGAFATTPLRLAVPAGGRVTLQLRSDGQ
jgi:hypothetical protein